MSLKISKDTIWNRTSDLLICSTDEYNLVNFCGFREAKLFSNPKNLEEAIDDFGEIIMATCNSSGTKVSITIAKVCTILMEPQQSGCGLFGHYPVVSRGIENFIFTANGIE